MKNLYAALLLGFGVFAGKPVQAENAVSSVRLYALDCGSIQMFDLGALSAGGEFKGQSRAMVDPCFLIRHPKGDLLWDAGLGQALADKVDGDRQPWGHLRLKTKLTDQLAAIGMTPADVEYLSLSHSHWDHLGNANLFAASTFIVNAAEHAYMFSEATKANAEVFSMYAALEKATTVKFTDEYQVFGDNSVVITSMPGHTPGHSTLLIRLVNAGSVMLTGDLYILSEGLEIHAVPTFNTDKVQTLVSMERFDALAKAEGARVIIQHDKAAFESLPKFPAYLD